MPITYTPLRFPGGKSKIYPFVSSLIKVNALTGCTYAEPFCGGAGLAIKLLLLGEVSRVALNDFDPAVYSAWDAIVRHPDELCEFIGNVDLSINEWERQRDVYKRSHTPSVALGKAAFYLNRTNRSGILKGGVIGGKGQTGRYGIDARFNRDGLCQKVRRIAEVSDRIELSNVDAMDFMLQVAPRLEGRSLVYLDPPYVKKGPGLYESSFGEGQHRALAKSVRSYQGDWMVTYDMDPLVDEIYRPSGEWPISAGSLEVGYSAHRRRSRKLERLLLSPGLVDPREAERHLLVCRNSTFIVSMGVIWTGL